LTQHFAKQWCLFATAIMFMTRIPVGNAASGKPEDLAASTQYFPLVGIVIGAAAGLVYWISVTLWANSVAVVLAMLVAVLLTGGFHEDGLADVADSAGAWTAEKKLEIMRDSRIGTYGALALILCFMLGIAALIDVSNTTVEQEHTIGFILTTLILAHVLGRWSSLVLIDTTAYARDDATNKVFVESIGQRHIMIGNTTTLFVVIACHVVLSYAVIVAVLASAACIFLSRRWYIKKVNGITGDCLGATNKLVETSVYLSVAAYLS